jgi:TolB-like protein/Flp pilus assembly protein TadD
VVRRDHHEHLRVSQDSTNKTTVDAHVFVSYASQDAGVANSIVESLEAQGLKCWMAPRDVKPGAQYADAIVRAINEAKALVLVMSESAVGSSHVGKEIERASSKRKPIIAFRIDAAPLNHAMEYFLSESQWIDVKALGMPAALAKLAEAVGQGPKTSPQDVTAAKQVGGSKKRIAIAATAVVVALGVAAGLGIYFWSSKHVAQAPSVAVITDKSIAVLPFVDMSEKKDQEYFGDGMAEEIIDLLVKIPGLKVIGRTSSFQFKGRSEDLRSIGQQLGVAYVLEGSVRKSGDRVRITAQLTNAQSGTHEWSDTYDRTLGDVLNLQDAIAAAVVREMQIAVAPAELSLRSTVRTPEAYNLYLRGLHAADRWDKEGLDEAVTLFEQALDLDATFSDAAAELGNAYETLGEEDFLKPAVAFEHARSATATALKLNPRSARAHTVSGAIYLVYDWDWAAAEREFDQVATLAPSNADALNGKGIISMAFGRWDDALRQINAALAQDPLRAGSHYLLAEIQMRRGRLDEAEAAIRRGLDIRPTYEWGRWLLGLVLLARGDRNAALLEMQRLKVETARQSGLAMAHYALGNRSKSDAALNILLQEHADDDPYIIAIVYAFRGQSDDAMLWLERAYSGKDSGLIYIKVEQPLKHLEGDPRYATFLKKMNLPE